MPDDKLVSLHITGQTERYVFYENRQLIFWWQNETQSPNILWVRILRIGLRWPPVKYLDNFMDVDREE